MASRNDRDRRNMHSRPGEGRTIGSRDTWRGGGEFGIGNFEQEQYRSPQEWRGSHERHDEAEHFERATAAGDHGLYEMRGGLAAGSHVGYDRERDRYRHHHDDHPRHHRRGLMDRILGRGHDDDDERDDRDRYDVHHRDDRGYRDDRDDRGYHRSWFGADDYDDDRIQMDARRTNRELSDRNMGSRDRDHFDRNRNWNARSDRDDYHRNDRDDYHRYDRDDYHRYDRDDYHRRDIGGMRRTDITPLGKPALGAVRDNRDINLLRGGDYGGRDRYSSDRYGSDRFTRDERPMRNDHERRLRDERWSRHNRQLREATQPDNRDYTSRGGAYDSRSREWDDETRSRWRSQPVDIDRRHYTDEDDDDRRLRGLRGDMDPRSRQFASNMDDVGDDMRGQFHRSRNDGEMGRRGFVEEVRHRDNHRR